MNRIHMSADVHNNALLWENISIRNRVQIREWVRIWDNTSIWKWVYIDCNVIIWNNVKIQNNVSIYDWVTIADWVFVGPHVCFTNDKLPRAINIDWSVKNNWDRTISKTFIDYWASIWANVTICPWVHIGKYALIWSWSVVTKSIPDYALAYGNPAKIYWKVDEIWNIIEKYND